MRLIFKGLLAVVVLFAVVMFGAMTVDLAAAGGVDNEGWMIWPEIIGSDSPTYEKAFIVRITHLPEFDPYGFEDPDRIAFTYETRISGGPGPVYHKVYRNGVWLGTSEGEQHNSAWPAYDPHADTVPADQEEGWKTYNTEVVTFEVWLKAPAGSTIEMRNVAIYMYDNIAMVFDNDFTDGDTDEIDSGTGTEEDPFIVENKYIYDTGPHSDNGIEVLNADGSWWIIRNCRFANADYGIYIENASNGVIQSNVFENCNVGIYLENCDNITIFGNRLENSVSEGIHLVGCGDVTVYYNYFENSGTRHAYDNETNNWDAGGHGNYWDDWQPPTYPEIGDTGIISLPRPIYGGFGVDAYPLVIAAGAYRTVVSISPGVQSGVVGDTVSFVVSVQNLGWNIITYDLSTSDVEGWTISLQSTVTVGAYDTESASMDVVVSSATAVGGSNTVTVTATSQSENFVTDFSTCIVIVTITPDVGIASWAASLAVGLGISEDSAGIMMSAMLLMAFLIPMGYIGFPMEGMIAFIIVLVGLTTALGWMPVWIAIMVGIGFALILARQLSNW